jgi:hypothetical protein
MTGRRIVRADALGTIGFGVTATLAAVIFSTPMQWLGAVTALALFGAGVFGFLWSYVTAIGRSRSEEITVVQLYLLGGGPTPRRVRAIMNALLATQAAIAAVTTFARLDGPDGNPGSSLAVGFLVPMFGFGMNGLWASRHATFGPRRLRGADAVDHSGESAVSARAIGQNDDHG